MQKACTAAYSGACCPAGVCVVTTLRALNLGCVLQIGRDSRLSGPLLASSMAAGIASRGARVAQFGLATTPAMFMSCIIEGEGIWVHLHFPSCI